MTQDTNPDMAVEDCVEPGKECSECGTHHKRVDGLPKKALTREEIAELKDNDTLAFIEALYYGPGNARHGVRDTVEAAEDLIVATETSARHISFEPQHEAWIVILDEPKECSCCTPREHGINLLIELSTGLKETLHEAGEPEKNPELAFRMAVGLSWPAEELDIDPDSFSHPPWEPQ
jgi:hypothetical protein